MLSQLRQIAIFAKTIEHGSFRKAAKALHLSPSVISHHIANLEEALGVALLYRSTRKLSLTSEGEKLLISAQAMIEAGDEFLRVATNQTDQLIGELKVSLPAVMQRSNIVNIIGDFSNAYPSVSLELDFSDRPKNLIQDRIDIAIRMGWLEDSGLKARKLYTVDRVVVVSGTYLKSKPNLITLEEIETWDWVELSSVGLKQIFTFPKNTKQTFRPKSRIRVNSAYAIHQLVSNHSGIAVLPKYLVEKELASGEFVQILPELEIKQVGVFAVWPPNAPKNGLTDKLVTYLRGNLPN